MKGESPSIQLAREISIFRIRMVYFLETLMYIVWDQEATNNLFFWPFILNSTPEYIQQVSLDSQKLYGSLKHRMKLSSTRIMNNSYVRVWQMELFSTLPNGNVKKNGSYFGIRNRPSAQIACPFSFILLLYYWYSSECHYTSMLFFSLRDNNLIIWLVWY